jgi:ribosomal protein S3
MGQKTPPSGLRLTLNRDYDLCWYQESKSYSNTFLKDYKYRCYLQDICSQLPSSIYSGRFLSSMFPKKYEVQFFTFLNFLPAKGTTVTIGAGKNEKKLKNTGLKSQNLQVCGNLLESQFRSHQFSNRSLGQKLSITPKAVKKKDVETIGQKWTKCQTDVQVVRTTTFESSAKFFNTLLIQSFQSTKGSNSYRKTLQNCLELAKRSPDIKGIRILCAGRLNGAERARHEIRSWGQTSLQRFDARLDYSSQAALTNTGLLGIKVWVLYV